MASKKRKSRSTRKGPGFLEMLARAAIMNLLLDREKKQTGTIDPYKTSGMLAGMGYNSPEDLIVLGELMERKNQTISSSRSISAPATSWRMFCEDGSAYGLDPMHFMTEEDYEEALDAARYGWREKYASDSSPGLDAEDFETEEEFLEAKYAWREGRFMEENLDPEDFETEEAFDAAVEEARLSWREDCEDGRAWGILPEEFETEEAYAEALEAARHGWREDCDQGETEVDPEAYETKEEYEEALEEFRHGWRMERMDGLEYGLDPEDYDTEEEYDAALDALLEQEEE